MWITVPVKEPSAFGFARNGGREIASVTGGPNSSIATPRLRCAATGPNMSRAWKVLLTGVR
jgi:hypothetical protein